MVMEGWDWLGWGLGRCTFEGRDMLQMGIVYGDCRWSCDEGESGLGRVWGFWTGVFIVVWLVMVLAPLAWMMLGWESSRKFLSFAFKR